MKKHIPIIIVLLFPYSIFFNMFCGSVCMMIIFTWGFSIALMLFDGISIFLSGLIGVAAVKRSHTNRSLSTGQMLIHGILQFIFCLDVISAIAVFLKEKRFRKNNQGT